MYNGATLIHEKEILPVRPWFDGPALILVFLDRILYSLRQLRLDLRCSDRNAVHEEDHVEGLAAGGLIVYLVHDAEDIRVILFFLIGEPGVIGVMPGALDSLISGHFETFTQRCDGPGVFEGLDEGHAEV